MGAASLFVQPLRLASPPMPETPYALDHPTWTLSFELLANMLHAMLAPRLTNRVLELLIGLSALLLVGMMLNGGGLDVNAHPTNYLIGIPRVCFSYFLGVLLYRRWSARRVKPAANRWAIVLALIAILLLPVAPEYRAYYDLIAVLVLIPTLVYHAASVCVGSAKWLLPLGTASYAYYVLHVPFGLFCASIAAMVGIDLPTLAEPLSGVVVMGLLLVLCLWLDRCYDLPLRRWLATRIGINRAKR